MTNRLALIGTPEDPRQLENQIGPLGSRLPKQLAPTNPDATIATIRTAPRITRSMGDFQLADQRLPPQSFPSPNVERAQRTQSTDTAFQLPRSR